MSNPSENHIPVRISTIRASDPLTFDAFVEVNDRLVKYRSASQTFEADLLQKFKAKKVKKIFILESEESQYLAYLDRGLDALQGSEATGSEKAEFAHETMTQEAENAEKNLETEEGYNSSKDRIGKVIDYMTSDTSSLKNLLASAGISVDNSTHSSWVASMSVALAAQAGMTDKDELTAMSFASLLHDIGALELGIGPELHPSKMSKAQIAQYRKHPERSVELLAGKKFITPRVLRLVMDHHEVGEGVGFPERKKLRKLPLSSQVFNLCEAFDHYSIGFGKPHAEVFEEFMTKHEEWFELSHFEILEKAINP